MTHQPGGSPAAYTVNGSTQSSFLPGGLIGVPGSVAPTNLTTFTLTPAVTGTELPVTFGHVFPAGAVPAGTSVEVVGKTTQFDAKATHADGSVRHAVLTALTNTSAGVPEIVTLRTRAPVSGAAISKADVLASAFSASVSLVVGATTYTLSARDLLDNTVTPLQNLTHLSGPQCSEFIVGGPVRNGATPHAHLAAYFHVRAYGSAGNVTRVRCDAVVENGWSFVSGSNAFTYAATVVVGGVTVYTNAALTHYHHTRWHQAGWWGGDPQVRATPNLIYLRDTMQVPNYDRTVTPSATILNGYTQTIVPMERANLRTDWSPGGDHPQIALMPEWYASYVMSGDVRAFNAILANDSAGGSYSYHYRDEATGAPVSIDTYPAASLQDPLTLVPGSGGNVLLHDAEHQPLLGYLGYLLTGDFYYLEELQFLANWGMLWHPAGNRGGSNGIITNSRTGNREIAWSLRNQAAAGMITPDSLSTLKAYFTAKANNNINNIAASSAVPPSNPLGIRLDDVYPVGYFAGWQMDYLISVLNWSVDVGYTSSNAIALRDFVNKWPAGRLGQSGSGYCPTYAAFYNFGDDVSDRGVVNSSGVFRTFQQLYQYKFPTESAAACPVSGPMFIDSRPTEPYAYYATMQPAVAMGVDSGVVTRGSWDRFVTLGVPDYSTGPAYAIVPRSPIPAWYSSLAVLQAVEFPNTNLSALDPCPSRTCSYSGIDGQADMLNAWNGGVFDTNKDRLILWGGGHNNYGGNEIYAFSLMSATWSMLTQPSDPAKRNDEGDPNPNGTRYADGRPSARHTVGALAFSARHNAMLSTACGASYGNLTIDNLDCDSFSFETLQWTIQPKQPGLDQNGVANGTICGYNPLTGEIWARPNSNRPLNKFNFPDTGTVGQWTQYAESSSVYLGNGCFDYKRNRLIMMGSSLGQQFKYWDVITPNAQPVTITTTGAAGGKAMESRVGPGLIYDPVGDRYIGWDGGATLYVLDPVTWVWSTMTMTGFTPGAPNAYGSYGRFAYSPRLRGVMCVSATNQNVWFCRL